MIKSLLTAGTAVALSVGAASAADLPAPRRTAAVFTAGAGLHLDRAYFGINAATPIPRPTG